MSDDEMMTPAKNIQANGNIPTGKWEFFCWLCGQFAKGGPTALVLLIVLGMAGYGLDKYLTSQTKILQQMADVQATMRQAISDKNETIAVNHELLIRSEERDRAIVEALTKGNVLSARIGDKMDAAADLMSGAPERGEKQVTLLETMVEEIRALRKNEQAPPITNDGGA